MAILLNRRPHHGSHIVFRIFTLKVQKNKFFNSIANFLLLINCKVSGHGCENTGLKLNHPCLI